MASSGIGTIAAGVAKAKADVILISGHSGGTGASPQTSVKFVGIPWEMGLTEVNQVLTLNNLRHKVTLRTDGGLKTGRDVVIAAMMGAEEFGMGTSSLVAICPKLSFLSLAIVVFAKNIINEKLSMHLTKPDIVNLSVFRN